jgi:ferredoxin
MKVKLDREGCIACGLCIDICPNIFYMGEDGKANLTTDIVQEEFQDSAREAADACPVSVIHIEED